MVELNHPSQPTKNLSNKFVPWDLRLCLLSFGEMSRQKNRKKCCYSTT